MAPAVSAPDPSRARTPSARPPGRRAAPRPAYGELGLWAAAVVLITTIGLAAAGAHGPVTLVLYLCLLCFAVSAVRTLTLVRAATVSARKRAGRRHATPEARHRVSVIVPCHDEEAVVDRIVRSLLDLDYPQELLQLILVDDGSADATYDRLRAWEAGHPGRMLVLHRPPGGGGKSAALNHAARHATGEVLVVYDADHAPDRDALRHLAACFDDPRVGAAQGRCIIANGEDSLLARLVAVDYLGGYLISEQGRSAYAGMPSYGGANCAVRHGVLREIGGWNERSLTEDTDLTLRVLLAGHEVRYAPDALDHEEAVTGLRAYWRQRHRWATGHQQVCRDYLGQALRHPGISAPRKAELVYYLLIYHLPLAGLVGLVAGVPALMRPQEPFPVATVLWPLLFAGPLIQLGAALVATRAPARRFLLLPLYFPLYVFGLLVVAKAWCDGVTGRAGGWAKTTRAEDGMPDPADPFHGGAPTVASCAPAGAAAVRWDRFPHARGRRRTGVRQGLASSVRWAPLTTLAVLAATLACHALTKDTIRGIEAACGAAVARLLVPALDAPAVPPGYGAVGSAGPTIMAGAAVAVSMCSIVRLPALLLGTSVCAAVAFAGSVLHIALLSLLAESAVFRGMPRMLDVVTLLLFSGVVLAGLIALFTVAARGSRVRLLS